MMIALGKRSDARGYGRKMISSFFSFWCPGARNQKEKKRLGSVGLLPRAAASAALPGAIIMPPLRGSGMANRIHQARCIIRISDSPSSHRHNG